MAAKSKPFWLLDVDEKPAIQALKRLQGAFWGSSTQINQSLELVSKGLHLVTGSVSTVVGAVASVTKQAMESERVERRLIAAIKVRGGVTDAMVASLKTFNGTMQQTLGYDAEHLLALEGTLAAMGVAPEKLQEATKATLALAEAQGIGAESASRAVGKAMLGNVGVLREYGVQATSTADAMQQLGAMWSLAEAQGASLETRLKVLDANWGDLQETLGGAISQSGAVAEGVGAISAALLELQDYFGSKEGREAVNGFFSLMLYGAANGLDAVNGLVSGYKSLASHANAAALASGSLGDGDSTFTFWGELLARWEDGPQLSGSDVMTSLADRLRVAAGQSVAGAPSASSKGGPRRGSRGSGAGGAAGKAGDEGLSDRALSILGGPTDADAVAAEMAKADAMASLYAQEQSALREHGIQMAEIERAANRAMVDEQNDWIETMKAGAQSIAAVATSAISDMITGMTQALVRGEDLGKSLKGFFGDMMVAIGSTMIQLGTAALALIALSSIPFFGIAVGNPVALGIGGGAAIAGGIGLVAAGTAMGGGTAAQSTKAPSAGHVAPRSSAGRGQGYSDPFGRGSENGATTININFGRGFVFGSPARLAREIGDVLAGAGA